MCTRVFYVCAHVHFMCVLCLHACVLHVCAGGESFVVYSSRRSFQTSLVPSGSTAVSVTAAAGGAVFDICCEHQLGIVLMPATFVPVLKSVQVLLF